MTSETNNTTTEKASKEQQYRMDPAEIPVSLRETVATKLGKDADVYPSKDGGNYKGRIVHADEHYIVQAIGKSEKTAVVHDRREVEIKGAALLSRAANNDLADRNVQIHYRERGQDAAMYPWNPQKEAEKREQATNDRRASAGERVMEAAQNYANEHMKTPKQREAFLQHVGNVVEIAMPKREQAKTQDGQQIQQAQQRTEPVQER